MPPFPALYNKLYHDHTRTGMGGGCLQRRMRRDCRRDIHQAFFGKSPHHPGVPTRMRGQYRVSESDLLQERMVQPLQYVGVRGRVVRLGA